MGPKEKEIFAMALSAIKWEQINADVFSNKGGIPPHLGQTVDHG